MDARATVYRQSSVSSVKKVTAVLICLSGVNCQVLKTPTTLSDKFKSSHEKIPLQK